MQVRSPVVTVTIKDCDVQTFRAGEQWFQSRIGKRVFEISTLHGMIDSAQKGLLIQDELHAYYLPEYEQLNKSLFFDSKEEAKEYLRRSYVYHK